VPIVPLLDVGEGYKSRTVSAQRRVNLYVEIQSTPDKSSIVMYGTPGLTQAIDFGTAPVRGAWAVGTYAYIVAGSLFYKVSPNGSFTWNGTLATSGGRVSMSDNGTQVIIVDGTAGYLFNLTTLVFSTITDLNFPNGASSVCFLAGYFIVNKAATGQFWWSNVYDGATWNALQFATAESNPDDLVAVSADHGVLYLLGVKTTEFWAPSGDTAVWRRVGGAGIEWGLAAPWSFDRFMDHEIFLAKNRMGQYQVVVLQGYTATSISTPEVTQSMNQQTSISGASGYSYMLDGHPFYQINFPAKSYLYDGLSNAWSEVSSNGGRHFGELRFSFQDKPYVADYRNGLVYLVDAAVYTDNGTAIVREWETKHVFHDLDRLSVYEFQVEFEPGVGLVTGQGSDPQAMLQISRDGGATWGAELWSSIGMMGAYIKRVIWRRLGRARDFVFRVRVSDPVKVVIVNALLKVG